MRLCAHVLLGTKEIRFRSALSYKVSKMATYIKFHTPMFIENQYKIITLLCLFRSPG